MPAVAYVNGRYGPIDEATVSIEDRGFQFADSLYEVAAFFNGHLLDWDAHMWRLRRGLSALMITGAPSEAALGLIARKLIRQSRQADGLIYVQISRGAGKRDHGFPQHAVPTVVMTARRFDFRQRIPQLATGVEAITLPDQRWHRCDLKTTGLLSAVLAKQEARRQNAFEAIFVRDKTVTEGSSTNIYRVDQEGVVHTHPLSTHILPGIARASLLERAAGAGIKVVEEAFDLQQAIEADELFLTSTTAPILPIVKLDGRPIGGGKPGPVTQQLGALIWAEVQRQTQWA